MPAGIGFHDKQETFRFSIVRITYLPRNIASSIFYFSTDVEIIITGV